jgi:hypothetical protein
MADINRGRVTVVLGDGWKHHARFVPSGFEPLGLVTRKNLTQSLARGPDGEYYAFGTGTPEQLRKQKVEGAIAAIKTGMRPLSQAERMKANAERRAAHQQDTNRTRFA